MQYSVETSVDIVLCYAHTALGIFLDVLTGVALLIRLVPRQ